ncbi:MAG: peptidase dimerization domain-containing protein [Rectinemataceae bacterium]|nr:peptidase dimerization domain-containing protein [Rectinemataceae bacterium]
MEASTYFKEIEEILRAGRAETEKLASLLQANPELGFREIRTAAILAEAFHGTDARIETGLALTGVRAEIGTPGAPTIFLIADMDAILTPGVSGGVAHSCGHHAQMTVMVAVFRALAAARVPEREGVRIVFLGTPAEEYLEMEHRLSLRAEGKIRFLSGKQEMIRLGLLDDACVALKYHSMADTPERTATVNGTLNGFMAKRASFIGKSAHAGAFPEKGINALNAASIAMLAIHAQRETFRDDDHIRVHPVMKSGGLTVNTVPDLAVLETYVRGASFASILDAGAKVDRALAAGAVAVGGSVRIENAPGYQPFRPDPALGEVLGRAAFSVIDPSCIDFHDEAFASDDIGDVASLVPTCQLGYSGFTGTVHGADFCLVDPERAFHEPARILAAAVFELARDKGALALSIRNRFKPVFSRADYVDSIEKLFSTRTLAWDPAKA